MNDYMHLKPRYRSRIRLFFGIIFYRIRKYLYWYFGSKVYAKDIVDESFGHEIESHATPLFRKLKDVDMWLQHNKVENLKLAVKRLDGIVIRPGETFSYWKLIGKPTQSKGYKSGMILYYGKFTSGIGGGLCQLSNIIYWMALHTPLTVTERYRHSFDVFPDTRRSQPFGSGATCVYNYRDLGLRNDTNESYQLRFWIEEGELKGSILSDTTKYFNYEVYEAEHRITHEYWGAYIRHNEIRRKVYDLEDTEIDDLYVCENHALMMYEPFLTAGSGCCSP